MTDTAGGPLVGYPLKEAREAARLTQAAAARALGVDPVTLSRWERGVQPIKARDRIALVQLYERTIRERRAAAPPLSPDERTRLVQLEGFVRQVRALLERVEAMPAGGARSHPPDTGLLVPATDEEAERRARAIDEALGRTAAATSARKRRRDGTTR